MTSSPAALTSLRNFRATAFATAAVTNSSGTVTLTNGVGQDLEFKNVGTIEAFVNPGILAVANAGTTGVETSQSIPGGMVLVYNYPNLPDGATIAFITLSGSTTLRISQGTGS